MITVFWDIDGVILVDVISGVPKGGFGMFKPPTPEIPKF
jgi:hypothetical protein